MELIKFISKQLRELQNNFRDITKYCGKNSEIKGA